MRIYLLTSSPYTICNRYQKKILCVRPKKLLKTKCVLWDVRLRLYQDYTVFFCIFYYEVQNSITIIETPKPSKILTFCMSWWIYDRIFCVTLHISFLLASTYLFTTNNCPFDYQTTNFIIISIIFFLITSNVA